jgi:hypothetical protein
LSARFGAGGEEAQDFELARTEARNRICVGAPTARNIAFGSKRDLFD